MNFHIHHHQWRSNHSQPPSRQHLPVVFSWLDPKFAVILVVQFLFIFLLLFCLKAESIDILLVEQFIKIFNPSLQDAHMVGNHISPFVSIGWPPSVHVCEAASPFHRGHNRSLCKDICGHASDNVLEVAMKFSSLFFHLQNHQFASYIVKELRRWRASFWMNSVFNHTGFQFILALYKFLYLSSLIGNSVRLTRGQCLSKLSHLNFEVLLASTECIAVRLRFQSR